MADALVLAAQLFGPFFFGLVLHGVTIKFGWFSWLYRPIDGGAVLSGKRIFGDNKTYRGLVVVSLGSAAGYSLVSMIPGAVPNTTAHWSVVERATFGLAVGIAATLSELPNSFLKRRFDVLPGRSGSGAASVAFYIVDQVDFLLGAWIVVWFIEPPSLLLAFASAVFVLVVHQAISVAGWLLGMRSSAR